MIRADEFLLGESFENQEGTLRLPNNVRNGVAEGHADFIGQLPGVCEGVVLFEELLFEIPFFEFRQCVQRNFRLETHRKTRFVDLYQIVCVGTFANAANSISIEVGDSYAMRREAVFRNENEIIREIVIAQQRVYDFRRTSFPRCLSERCGRTMLSVPSLW